MQKYRNLYHFLYFFSNPSSLPGLQCMNGIHNIHLLYLSGRPSYCQQCGHNSNSHNHHKLSVWYPPCGPPSGGHQPLIHKTMGRQAHKNSCRRSEKSIYHSLRPDHMEKLFPLHPDGPHHTALVHSSGNAHIDIIDDMQYGYQKDYRKETIDKYGKGKLYCLCFFFVFSGIGKLSPSFNASSRSCTAAFSPFPFFRRTSRMV